jgi:2'-5' RNA ligase
VRRQLSLYVPESSSAALEAVRRTLDPLQHNLIPAHITLCRDDEAAQLTTSTIEEALSAPHVQPLTLSFGQALTFDGHGVLLPCISGEDQFASLRALLLGAGARRQTPHITLAHPRNPRSSSYDLADALSLPAEITLTFSMVSLIEQPPGQPWRVVRRYSL